MSSSSPTREETQLEQPASIGTPGAEPNNAAQSATPPHVASGPGRLIRRAPAFESGLRAEAPQPRLRKIPSELRRGRTNFSEIPQLHHRLVERLAEDFQFVRSAVQLAFALLCIWIGIEFYLFVRWRQTPGTGRT